VQPAPDRRPPPAGMLIATTTAAPFREVDVVLAER
jgi:hypothetical protein